jgi:hypothetical protein
MMLSLVARLLLALDFLTGHLQASRFVVLDERTVETGTSAHALANSMKATHVKLTWKGLVFCLLAKTARHRSSGKAFHGAATRRCFHR